MCKDRRKIIQNYLAVEQEKALKYESDLVLDLNMVWEPHPAQAQIKSALFGQNKKLAFIESGRKFGKTDIVVYCLYRYALSNPNSACYFIAPFQKQARELIWANNRMQNFFMPNINPQTGKTHQGYTREEAHQIYEELKEKYGVKITDNDMRIRFGNGSFIKLDGADNFEAYRGINPHFIAYDEFKDHHPKFHIGMDPNLATFDAPLLAIGTPCAGDEPNETGFNGLADYAKIAEHGAYFNFPSWSNPHVNKAFFVRKRAELFAKGEDDVWFREYCSKRVKSGQKTIFPMLNKKKHVVSEEYLKKVFWRKIKDWDKVFSFDPASSSCFAGTLYAINKYTKQILVLDEIYETKKEKMSSGQIFPRALKILDKWKILIDDTRFIYDSAALWFYNEVYNEFGIAMEPSIKDIKKKKDIRLSLIKDCLLIPGCILFNEEIVHDSLELGGGLFWEMENYRVDDNGKIPKEDDHALDEFRYALSNLYYDKAPDKPPGKDPNDERRGFTPDQDLAEDINSHFMEQHYADFYI